MEIKLKCKNCKMQSKTECIILKYLSQFIEENGPWKMSTWAFGEDDCTILMLIAGAKGAISAIKTK